MKCKNCNAEVNRDEVLVCAACNSGYCGMCSSMAGICSCYGDLKYLN